MVGSYNVTKYSFDGGLVGYARFAGGLGYTTYGECKIRPGSDHWYNKTIYSLSKWDGRR